MHPMLSIFESSFLIFSDDGDDDEADEGDEDYDADGCDHEWGGGADGDGDYV